ncbi:hypothetical protein OpiT1DRAFT_03835 [Opitutaceae bacterium TAV1]|nr:hypothetical protein OpiT1DRAFT_03835 [Opitutaceae bacterium TAV1]
MSWKFLNNFTGGEWTPLLDGRSDLEKYEHACRRLENMRIMPYGGARFRSGFAFVAPAASNDFESRLMPFSYSTADRYMLEWGNFTLRIYSVATASQVFTLATVYPAAAVHALQYRQINDVVYIVHPDYPPQKLSRYANDNWTLGAVEWDMPAMRDENTTDTTLALAATSGDGVTMTASTPLFRPGHVGSYWELRHIRNAQSISLKLGAGTGSFTYEKRERNSMGNWGVWQDSTAWEFTEYTVTPDPDVEVRATGNSSSGTGSYLSAPITFSGTWSISTSGTWYGTLIVERQKGDGSWETVRKYVSNSDRNIAPSSTSGTGKEERETTFRLRYESAGDPWSSDVWKGSKPSNYTYPQATLDIEEAFKKCLVKVTAVTDTTHAQVDIIVSAASTAATDVWSEGAWSAERGFPRAIGLYEQRLYFGGVRAAPNTVWGSCVDDFENFAYGTEDDDGMALVLAASEQNNAQWIESLKRLMLATTSREFTVAAGASDEPLTPTNMMVKSETARGGAHLQPLVVQDAVLYVDRQNQRLLEMAYSIERDGYVSVDLTLLGEHVGREHGGIRQLGFCRQPDPLVLAVLGDGQLGVMTYDRSQDVTGWARWITEGQFDSVAATYGNPGDEIWCVVRRRIGGAWVRQIERLTAESSDLLAGTWLDGAVEFQAGGVSAAALTHASLSRFAGATVCAVIDGRIFQNCPVAGSTVTLPREVQNCGRVVVGFLYVGKLHTMKFDSQTQSGPTQGRKRRVSAVILRFFETSGAKCGHEDGMLEKVHFRTTDGAMDSLPPPLTGDKEVVMPSGYDRDAGVIVVQDNPAPMTVIGLAAKWEVLGD